MASAVTGKAIDIPILKRILGYLTPYKKAFYISVGLTLLLTVLNPIRPIMVQYTIDHFVMVPNPEGLIRMTLLMIGLLLFQTLVQYYHTWLTNWLGLTVVRDLRIKLYKHILNFRLKFFDHTPIGILITRTVSDLENIADIFSEGLIVIIGDLLTLFVIVAFMFYIDWRLTLISLSTIPLLMIATKYFQEGIRVAFQEVRTQVAHLNVFVQEHITGMSIVQIFNREEEEMNKFKGINRLHAKAHIKSVWYYSIFFPVVELLSATSIGLLVWYGAREVMHSTMTIGNVIAFVMYINMLFRPIRELADKFNTLQMGMVSSDRVFKVLDTIEVIPNEGTIELSAQSAVGSQQSGTVMPMAIGIPQSNDYTDADFRQHDSTKAKTSHLIGNIEFKNVWFAYNQEDWILRDISFKVNAGQTLALVGATGAGKSSVTNLVNRFYEYNLGSILFDGINIRDYELHALRRNIAVVLQDVFLFSDTIANNISLSDTSITRDQIIEAAKAVGANRFIERLPGGYDFNVMERGGMLSVGQRQLIAFIRAYVFNPKILILDEATSSIDSESEELIRQATQKLTENRTSIIIAHRLSTIQNADNILVFDHGEIKEQGTHQQLLSQNGIYKKLYEIQFANVISS